MGKNDDYFDKCSLNILNIFYKELSFQMKNLNKPKEYMEFMSSSLKDIIFFEGEKPDQEAVVGILNMFIYAMYKKGFFQKLDNAIENISNDEEISDEEIDKKELN